MPITSSAKKALRASRHKRVFNVRRKETMKDVTIELKKLIAAKDKAGALKLFPTLQKSIDKAAKRGVLEKNTAARKKSRFISAIKKIS